MNSASASFQPITLRAKLVCGCLIVHSVLADVMIIHGALLALYAAKLRGATPGRLRWVLVDSVMAPGAASILLHIVTFVLFLIWLMRVFDNLGSLGAKLRFGKISAVASFLVPGASFFLPPYFLRVAWYGSAPDFLAPDGSQKWPSLWSWPRPVVLWWALFWLSYVGSALNWDRVEATYALFRAGEAKGAVNARITGSIEFVAGLAYLASALATIRMVRQITRWQDQRYEQSIAALIQQPATPS